MAERDVRIRILVESAQAQQEVQALESAVRVLTQAHTVQVEEVRQLGPASSEAGRAATNGLKEAEQAAEEFAGAAEKAAGHGGTMKRLFAEAMDEARNAVTALKAGDLGGALSAIGKASVVLGPVAYAVKQVADGFTYAVGNAVGFEEAMVGVAKTTGMAGAELDGLGKDLLALSAKLGMSQQELAGIAEAAGQLGIQGRANLAAFTETVAKVAATSDLTAEEAAVSMAKVGNAFRLPIEQAEKLASTLNELGNTTTAGVRQLVQTLGNIGGAAAAIGFTVDQVAALGATLIDTGVDAATAGTSLRNVFIRMQTESKDLAKVAGLTGAAFRDMLAGDPMDALEAYLAGLARMPEHLRAIEIKKTFGDQNFLAVSTLVEQTELLNRNLATSQQAFEEGTSINREFAATLDAVSTQWRILTAHLDRLATLAGWCCLPWRACSAA
jgi:TP901 family phage tail tape measure protein